ncbi:UNVERIFIED_CONTAM: hypothetical protein DES50_12115 [Williamsia faeni]
MATVLRIPPSCTQSTIEKARRTPSTYESHSAHPDPQSPLGCTLAPDTVLMTHMCAERELQLASENTAEATRWDDFGTDLIDAIAGLWIRS